MTGHQFPLKPGVYFYLDEDIYHSDPFEQISLSGSLGKKLISQSPLHAWTDHPRKGGA